MLKRFLRRLSFAFNPPQPGDNFLGRSQDFVSGRVEGILHGLTHTSGDTKLFHFNGLDTYKLTIVSTIMPYYICESAVLTKPIEPTDYFLWSTRIQKRRMSKQKFKQMFIEGNLRRTN